MDYYTYLKNCNAGWHTILVSALESLDQNYLQELMCGSGCLPHVSQIFSAFSISLQETRYILLGESPYPRAHSANGYAFWDNAVESLWSPKGLSTAVNKATSLRNLIKMMLLARGDLDAADTSQKRIALLNKDGLIQTGEELFRGMMAKGILLLNASLIYSEGKVAYHARHWKPFMESLFTQLSVIKPEVSLILLGKIAETVPRNKLSVGLIAEHPYNISFITNTNVIKFFKSLDLLSYE